MCVERNTATLARTLKDAVEGSRTFGSVVICMDLPLRDAAYYSSNKRGSSSNWFSADSKTARLKRILRSPF